MDISHENSPRFHQEIPVGHLLVFSCHDSGAQDNGTMALTGNHGGCFSAIRLLLASRAQVDSLLTNKATPLYVACQNGQHQRVDLLLAFAADPNSQTENLATPLFIAAEMGRLSIVKKLVKTLKERLQKQLEEKHQEKFEEKELAEKVQQMLKEAIDRATRTNATPLFIAAQQLGSKFKIANYCDPLCDSKNSKLCFQ